MRLIHVELACDNFAQSADRLATVLRRLPSRPQLAWASSQRSWLRASSADNPGFVLRAAATPDSERAFLAPSGHRNELALAASDIGHRLRVAAPSAERANNTVLDLSLEVADVRRVAATAGAGRLLCRRPVELFEPVSGQSYLVNVLKSCVGNLWHTLVQPVGRRAPAPVGYANWAGCFDHVTLACERGGLDQVLHWYERVLGMHRFRVNSAESAAGFLVRHGAGGMRLKAFDHYWRCAEQGVASGPGLRFVLAESLPGGGTNQIDSFLAAHGGAGVQHVGLRVQDLLGCLERLRRDAVVEAVQPPDAYYAEREKLAEMRALRVEPSRLRRAGVLLDAEADDAPTGAVQPPRYLLQAFTKPWFAAVGEETFFLELLERRGARGFGAGNIAALWRAVEVYMQERTGVDTSRAAVAPTADH